MIRAVEFGRQLVGPSTQPEVAEAFERRTAPLQELAGDATALALACRDMAQRFSRAWAPARLGQRGRRDDAHTSVEYVHPVIVGKRALPAL